MLVEIAIPMTDLVPLFAFTQRGPVATEPYPNGARAQPETNEAIATIRGALRGPLNFRQLGEMAQLVRIMRRAVIANDAHARGRTKLCRNIVSLQSCCGRVPNHLFDWIGLAKAFKKPARRLVGIQRIDVINDDVLVTVLVQLRVHPKGSRIALDPTSPFPNGLTDGLALGQTRSSQNNKQIEISPTALPLFVLAENLTLC
ncbi:MAG: hypothetical protein ACI9HK_003257 [Pirellulaceae bacterium]|jgi:hypothetical protein